jgi:pimeloyl-ACP methyl ester carboxylesterase
MTAGMRIELLPPEAQEVVTRFTDPRQDLLLGYWHDVLTKSTEQLTDERTRELGVIAALGRPYVWVTGDEPDPAERQWMTSLLPRVEITVMAGSGHFPHLAHPARLAMIANLLGCTDLDLPAAGVDVT